MHLFPFFKNVLLVLSCVANQNLLFGQPLSSQIGVINLKKSILGNLSMYSTADTFAVQKAMIFILRGFFEQS